MRVSAFVLYQTISRNSAGFCVLIKNHPICCLCVAFIRSVTATHHKRVKHTHKYRRPIVAVITFVIINNFPQMRAACVIHTMFDRRPQFCILFFLFYLTLFSLSVRERNWACDTWLASTHIAYIHMQFQVSIVNNNTKSMWPTSGCFFYVKLHRVAMANGAMKRR